MCNRGATVAEVTRSLAITEATWYRWKNTYRGMYLFHYIPLNCHFN